MSLVAEVFPPASRQNSGSRARCYFYELGYPGTRWDVKPQIKWQGQLANERMPVEAVVSMDGWLVTLNEWGGTRKGHAIVVYDRRGRLVVDWRRPGQGQHNRLPHRGWDGALLDGRG